MFSLEMILAFGILFAKADIGLDGVTVNLDLLVKPTRFYAEGYLTHYCLLVLIPDLEYMMRLGAC